MSDSEVRPHADVLLLYILDRQDAGLCQLGICTTLGDRDAAWAAAQVLEQSTGKRWIHTDSALAEVYGVRRVWLFDEGFGESHPTFRHETSGTHMHMKNLELVLSASEAWRTDVGFGLRVYDGTCHDIMNSKNRVHQDALDRSSLPQVYSTELLSFP